MNLSIRELNELIYSLGITAHNGNFCDRELNESLLEKLYCELNERIAEEAIDEEIEDTLNEIAGYPMHDCWCGNEGQCDCISEPNDNDGRSHFVSKEDAISNKRERGLITQAILDYVDRKGAVSHGDLESYYKSITGSNSFSHVLQSLRTPYKNRKTQRYIAKEGRKYSDALYVVKVANPSNWVVASK